MANPRFYFQGIITQAGETVDLSPDESHHLMKVLRLRTGDAVDVFDAAGSVYRGEVVNTTKTIATIAAVEPYAAVGQPQPLLTIAVAVIKRRGMDLLVEKCSELGVDVLQPLLTERCVAQSDMKPGEEPPERWERVAIAAAKQSRRNVPLRVDSPMLLAAWVRGIQEQGKRKTAYAHFEEGAPTLGEWLRIGKEKENSSEQIVIAIGPEGGWSDGEAGMFKQAGFRAVRLGELTLRAETAAIAAAAAVRLL